MPEVAIEEGLIEGQCCKEAHTEEIHSSGYQLMKTLARNPSPKPLDETLIDDHPIVPEESAASEEGRADGSHCVECLLWEYIAASEESHHHRSTSHLPSPSPNEGRCRRGVRWRKLHQRGVPE